MSGSVELKELFGYCRSQSRYARLFEMLTVRQQATFEETKAALEPMTSRGLNRQSGVGKNVGMLF